jgi:HSP20 family protein
VADVKVSNESSQPGRGNPQPSQKSGGGTSLQRRGEFMPGFSALSPREFFSLSPFQMMRRFTEDLDRMFGGRGPETNMWAPPVEVRRQGNNLVVNAELPGLSKDDVQIEVTDEGLAISGERKHEHTEQGEGYYRSERSYGRFYRLIPLPDDANFDQAKANFNNGVLEITIPVPQSRQTRKQIPIETQQRGGTQTAGGGSQTRTSGGGA